MKCNIFLWEGSSIVWCLCLKITIKTTTISTKPTTYLSTKATLAETTPFKMGTPRHQLKTKPGIREVWWWVCVWLFVHIRYDACMCTTRTMHVPKVMGFVLGWVGASLDGRRHATLRSTRCDRLVCLSQCLNGWMSDCTFLTHFNSTTATTRH